MPLAECHAPLIEAALDFAYRILPYPDFVEPRLQPQRTEKPLGSVDGPRSALLVAALRDTPYALAVLEYLRHLLVTQYLQQAGEDDGERMSVRQAVDGRQLVPDLVRCPILRNPMAINPLSPMVAHSM